MTLPQGSYEQLVGDVRRVVLVHVDLFEHDVAFRVDLLLAERRAADHFGQNLPGKRQIGIADLGPVGRVFLRREGVVAGTDRIERF